MSLARGGEAIDYGDKSSNKAYSVAYREAIFKMFIVPFAQEDIENRERDLKAPPEAVKSPTGRSSRAPYRSPAARELDAKTRIVELVDKLNDGKGPEEVDNTSQVCVAFQHMEQASEKLRSSIASNTSVKLAGCLGYSDSR